jgi:hypothetical protein
MGTEANPIDCRMSTFVVLPSKTGKPKRLSRLYLSPHFLAKNLRAHHRMAISLAFNAFSGSIPAS